MTTPNDFGKSILIEDSLILNAKQIIKFAFPRNTDSVDVLCLEKSPKKWMSVFNEDFECKTHTDLKTLLDKSDSQPMNVLIDSVNQMAAMTSWETTITNLETLIKNLNVKRLVIILHTDCLLCGNKMVKHLRYMCSTNLILKDKENNRHIMEINNLLVSGKVCKTMNCVYYDDLQKKWVSNEIRKTLIAKQKSKEDMIHNLTSFKISVEKSAEKIKNDLVLPYTEVINTSNTKVIHDFEIDDWDDEDPDDDLNI